MTQIIIIGAGPAGIAAAIQLHRYSIHSLIFEKNQPGGLLREAYCVENYPGFPHGISGSCLADILVHQLRAASADLFFEEVFSLEFYDDAFFVKTSYRTITAPYCIIASGTVPRPVATPFIDKEAGTHIYQSVLPLLEREDKLIVIIGAGDAAFDYALHLAAQNEIIILNRGDKTRCLDLLFHRAMNSPRISYRKNTQVHSVRKRNNMLQLTCFDTTGTCTLHADYVLYATGRRPALGFITSDLQKICGSLRKSGLLHLIGDVSNKRHRQAGIAIGDGISAAMTIHEKEKQQEQSGEMTNS
ncbi:MAG: NAD(P)/FAD-dependent oxidoreductase [Methanospirillaceae archaeon]|nr:NAD(P)/FAD-dependent oxidoreductase [Methanospirillaceae archaeon]